MGIIGWIFVSVIAIGGAGAFIFQSVQAHGDAARSSYTQAHGVRQTVRVISESTNRDNPKLPTSALTVRLSRPVNGHDTTTVHIQGTPAYSPGAPVTVVVDPQDPGYAELPGSPYSSSTQWVIFLLIGIAFILLYPLIAVGVLVLLPLRRRRRLRRTLLY